MKRLLSALAIIALMTATASCAKQDATATTAGDLRIGLPIAPTNLNGVLAQNTNESFVDGLIYSQLVVIDNHGNETPDLAQIVPTTTNGGISKDGRTIVYHLRHNVKWQDGVPFTSKDVVFSFHAVMNPNNNVVSRRGFDQVASVSTPDPYTVIFHMKVLFAPAISSLFGDSDSPVFILPEHLLAKYPNLNQVAFNSAPVGTGPFKFARWLRGDRIVLVANDTYFRGKPQLKQVDLRLITDSNTTEAQLRSHDIDLAFELTGANYKNFAGDPAFVRTPAKAPSYVAFLFNMHRPPLNDVLVRRALNAAIDRASITAKNTYGAGTLAVGDLSDFYRWAYDPTLKAAPYDQKAADALFDQAGWHRGPGGVRMKNGKTLSLQLTYGQGSQTSRNIIAQVQQTLTAAGVNVTSKSYDFASLYASAQSGGIFNSGNFDIGFYAWTSGADPDDSSQWLSTQIPPAGNNISRYISPEMDAAQHAALSTFDHSARKKAYATIQRLLLRDQPGAFVYYQPERFVATPDLKGFLPNGIIDGWNAWQWSI